MPDDDEDYWDKIRANAAEHRRISSQMTARRYAHVLEASGITPAFELLAFTADDWGTMTIGRWGGYLLQIAPMAFNERIIMTPEDIPLVYDHGWCYDRGGLAFIALIGWDPAAEGEPAGYKKRATLRQREPGETAVYYVQPPLTQAPQ